jgi:hypothetical protein
MGGNRLIVGYIAQTKIIYILHVKNESCDFFPLPPIGSCHHDHIGKEDLAKQINQENATHQLLSSK